MLFTRLHLVEAWAKLGIGKQWLIWPRGSLQVYDRICPQGAWERWGRGKMCAKTYAGERHCSMFQVKVQWVLLTNYWISERSGPLSFINKITCSVITLSVLTNTKFSLSLTHTHIQKNNNKTLVQEIYLSRSEINHFGPVDFSEHTPIFPNLPYWDFTPFLSFNSLNHLSQPSYSKVTTTAVNLPMKSNIRYHPFQITYMKFHVH